MSLLTHTTTASFHAEAQASTQLTEKCARDFLLQAPWPRNAVHLIRNLVMCTWLLMSMLEEGGDNGLAHRL